MGSYRNTKPNHTRNFSHQFSSKRLDKLQKMTLQEIIAAELSEEVLLINETEAPQPSSKKQVRRRKSSKKAMKAKKSKKVAKKSKKKTVKKARKARKTRKSKKVAKKAKKAKKVMKKTKKSAKKAKIRQESPKKPKISQVRQKIKESRQDYEGSTKQEDRCFEEEGCQGSQEKSKVDSF